MGILRFVLAIAVVIAHAGPVLGYYLADGRFAVQMFYIISGFYMALVWNEKYAGAEQAAATFYKSRFLRIYPQYVIVLLLAIAVSFYAWVTQDRHPFAVAQHFPLSIAGDLLIYGTQISLLGMEGHLFLERLADGSLGFTSNFHDAAKPPLHYYNFVPQAWSLGLELTFYLLVPFLLPKLRFVIFVFVTSLILRVLGWRLGLTSDPWTYRFFPFEIALFLAGTLSLEMWRRLPTKTQKVLEKPAIFHMAGATFLVMLLGFGFARPILGEAAYWLSYMATFLLLPILFNASKKHKLDRAIGDLSYPVYISHLLVIWTLYFVFKLPLEDIVYITLVITIIISVLLNHFQKTFDDYRHSLIRQSSRETTK